MLTATHINYYFVCRRKLWLFSRDIQQERESELVALGRLLHEDSFKEKRKEYQFGPVKMDWLDLKRKVIHEVKKSDKVENAHIWQLKYYLLYFKRNNIEGFSGEINYPKLKKTTRVDLSDDDVAELENIEADIERILAQETPPPIEVGKKICRSCSYMEFCFA